MMGRPKWIQLLLVALLLATPVLSAAAGSPRDSFNQSPAAPTETPENLGAAALTWEIETVDAVGSLGRYASLAVDIHGNPLISYYDVGVTNLKLARFGGTTWQIETVDSGMVYPCPTSLALDSSGRPRISYCVEDMAGGSDLWYAAYDGANWQREMVTLETTPYASLAVDASGGPHIAFQAGHLEYASKVGGSWQVTSADSTPGTGPGVSLALDADDKPHISYLDGGSNQLKYAWHDGADWQISTLDDGMLARGQTSLALDGSGYAHIAYGSFFPPLGLQGLAYTYFDGAAWQPEIADSEGDAGWHASRSRCCRDAPYQPL